MIWLSLTPQWVTTNRSVKSPGPFLPKDKEGKQFRYFSGLLPQVLGSVAHQITRLCFLTYINTNHFLFHSTILQIAITYVIHLAEHLTQILYDSLTHLKRKITSDKNGPRVSAWHTLYKRETPTLIKCKGKNIGLIFPNVPWDLTHIRNRVTWHQL